MGTAKATASTEDELCPDLPAIEYELWSRGELRFLTREHHQREVYDACRRWVVERPKDIGPIVVNSHRKMGKSFFLDLFCWERALRKPWQVIRYLAPSYEQGRDYLFDIHRQIETLCPQSLRPKWSADKLLFRNPAWENPDAVSELELVGMRNPDAARGPRANVIVCDEVREWERLSYVWDNVLVYQFMGQEEPICIMTTTPPESMAHEFVTRFIPEAIKKGTYFLEPLDQVEEMYQPWYAKKPRRGRRNPDITEEDRELVARQCGGKKSVAYQREALCKLISDPASLIVPEFQEVKAKIVREFDFPAYFDAYTGIDFGWADANGAISAFVDFLQHRLCILDEVWLFNASTGALARAIRAMEERHFLAKPGERVGSREGGKAWRFNSIARVGDHSKQQLADLWFDHDIHVLEAEKWDKLAFLSQLRFAIQEEQIWIHPRCVQLVNQLSNGIWKPTLDGARKDFIRDNTLGHCDLIDALLYLFRRVAMLENPIPRKRHDATKEFIAPIEDEEAESERIAIEPLTIRFRPMGRK